MPEEKKIVWISDGRGKEASGAAEALREKGYEVIVNDPDTGVALQDEQALETLAGTLGERLIGVIHPAPPKRLAGVQNATDEDWIAAREEGMIASWAVTKTMAGRMAKNGGGAMVYLNSVHAEKPIGHGFLFSMGCSATQMLCREASQDYGRHNVRCFFVQCGVSKEDERCRNELGNFFYGVEMRYPQRKYPEEGYLNSLLTFLMTPEAWPLNGSDLRADGGMTMFYTHRECEEGVEYFGRRK